MDSLLKFTEDIDDIVRPHGVFDVLLLYGIVAPRLKKFLGSKEIASRIWLPSAGRGVLKRGSDMTPLSVSELAEAVTPELLEMRSRGELKAVEKDLTEVQRKVWSYFVPRHLCDLFYATNNEGAGKPIDRIFFDLDRGKGITADQAAYATKAFVDIIREDSELAELLGGRIDPFVSWTGRSFHVFLFLDEKKPAEFYDKYFQYSKKEPQATYTGRWVQKLKEEVVFPVSGGHEKVEGILTVDPSQTPSGKLCRVSLGALHMKDVQTVDGVSIPVTYRMLEKEGIGERLRRYRPEDVIRNLDKHAGDLPEKFRWKIISFWDIRANLHHFGFFPLISWLLMYEYVQYMTKLCLL